MGLHHGVTYNISLVALSVHLPSPVVGPNQITLGEIACLMFWDYLFIDWLLMHTEAPGSSSNVTSILEATTTLDIPFGSTASATASQVTHSLTPIDIGSPTTSTFSPTTNPQRTPEPTLSSTSSPIPTPNTTLYNTQDATTDTDDPSTPDTSPTPDTTPDPTLSHSAVLTASPKVTTSLHTTTDTDVTVTSYPSKHAQPHSYPTCYSRQHWSLHCSCDRRCCCKCCWCWSGGTAVVGDVHLLLQVCELLQR